MPKLSITSLEGKGAVATLNRWADQVGQSVGSNELAISGITRNVVALQNATPPTTSVGDGLVHGDPIWDIDSAVYTTREDFAFLNFVSNTSSNFIGEIPWYNISSGPGLFAFAPPPPHVGGVTMTLSSTASNSGWLIPGINCSDPSASGSTRAFLDHPPWKQVWVFQFRKQQATFPASAPVPFSMTQLSFYMGFANEPSIANYATSSSQRPSYFLGLRFDTDTTSPAISDTTFVFEQVSHLSNGATRNNAQGQTFNTGIAPTQNQWYRFEMNSTVVGIVTMTLYGDGLTPVSWTVTVPQLSMPDGIEVGISNQTFYPKFEAAVGFSVPLAPGTIATIAGLTGGSAYGNGTFTLDDASLSYGNVYQPGAVDVGQTFQAGATGLAYPAYAAFVGFGNDTTASPTFNRAGLCVDFYGEVWNPGVGGGTGTPNKTLSRYF